jgi:hypothetical protein
MTDEEKGFALGQMLGEVNPYLSEEDIGQHITLLLTVCSCQDSQQFCSGIGRGYEHATHQHKQALY